MFVVDALQSMEEIRMKIFLTMLFVAVIVGIKALAEEPIQALTIDQAVEIASKKT